MAEELVRAQTFTGANGAALAALEGDALVWLGAVGENPPKAGDRWSLAGSFVTLCLGRKTRPQRCDDVQGDGRVDAAFRGLHAKSLALAPVHDAGKVTGILAVFSGNSRAFNGMHTAVLQTEADSLAELVQQARQAAGIKDAEKKEETPAPQTGGGPGTAAASPENPSQQEFEAFESAFVVVPPSVAAPLPAPAAEAAPPSVPAARSAAAPGVAPAVTTPLPKLRVVTPPAPPGAVPTPAPERPTLPGFLPLSATAAALAKAQPLPPTPPEMAVETKAPKPAASLPPAAEAKKPAASVPAAPVRTTVPTPPPVSAATTPRPSAPASVTTPPPAPVVATPQPSAAAVKPSVPPAVKFVPLAKPPEVKTPPPGSLKPPVPTVPQSGSAGAAAPTASTGEEEHLLPAAADPFAEFAPVHVRRPSSATLSAHSTLAGLEMEDRYATTARGIWKLPLVVAVLAALALGGLWWRTTHHAAAKPAPVVTQPAPAPPANSEVTAAATAPGNPAATPAPVTVSVNSVSVPVSKPAGGTDKPAPEKTVPQAKTESAAAIQPPAATVAAPPDLEVKSPTPVTVPVATRQQEPPPKTMVSVPVAAAAKLPDLPKPEAQVAVRQASTPVPPQLVQSVTPVYPAAAKSLRLQGVVRLNAKVNPQGRVTEVIFVSGSSFFKDSAVSAVKQWRYKAATLDGQAVESTVEIILKFSPQ